MKKTKGKRVLTSKSIGWDKNDSQSTRRKNVLKLNKGNLLVCAKRLKSLAKRTTDPEIKRKATADAMHFEARNKRIKGNGKQVV